MECHAKCGPASACLSRHLFTLSCLLCAAATVLLLLAPPALAVASVPVAVFSYSDLHDASSKTEGGYVILDASTEATADPHGGYSAGSDDCAVCHASHRADGAYYLLRADSQSDACDYCHVGGSAHSSKVVYDLNPAGTATSNGHTLGAVVIPDSTSRQQAADVNVTSVDHLGVRHSETVFVRAYEPEPLGLYRLARNHSQEPVGDGESGWDKVGPAALTCMSCHQPHGAPEELWQPRRFDPAAQVTGEAGYSTAGYKLLRRYPSGSTAGAPNESGLYDASQAIKAIEDTALAGVNYSTKASADATYTENGVVATRPVWIAQGFGDPKEAATGGGPEWDGAVNQYALSWWCGDCHNLDLGGTIRVPISELGFKAHAERTHPVPFQGPPGRGVAQCYTCHRDDLAIGSGTADPPGYGLGVTHKALSANHGCDACHYGYVDYYEERTDTAAGPALQSDFPHAGRDTDIKLLGSYTIDETQAAAGYRFSTIGDSNLDAVCLRCHRGIGVHS